MSHRNNFLRKIEVYTRLLLGEQNKEKEILAAICKGKGADIGCGSGKITSGCIGVDLTGKNEEGEFGCEKGKKSEADFKASGDNLFMFKNNELDFVVAKHNLEHYGNPEKTLAEWKRVLKKGGKLGVIVPDNRYLTTSKLDKSHKSEFDLETLENLFKKTGLKVKEKGMAFPRWSIYVIGEK